MPGAIEDPSDVEASIVCSAGARDDSGDDRCNSGEHCETSAGGELPVHAHFCCESIKFGTPEKGVQ
jgi:hypothetical protein